MCTSRPTCRAIKEKQAYPTIRKSVPKGCDSIYAVFKFTIRAVGDKINGTEPRDKMFEHENTKRELHTGYAYLLVQQRLWLFLADFFNRYEVVCCGAVKQREREERK